MFLKISQNSQENICTGMRTEINKKRGRPSERSEEARAKGAKRGKNSWGVWGGGRCKIDRYLDR